MAQREHLPDRVVQELELLHELGYKAEIEILNSPHKPRFLVESYLPWKLHNSSFIPMQAPRS